MRIRLRAVDLTNLVVLCSLMLGACIVPAAGSSGVISTNVTAGSAATGTDIVTNANDGGPGSLRDTIANANTGDTITFAPNLGPIILGGTELAIGKTLSIAGPVGATQTISGAGKTRVFKIAAGSQVVLANLTITGGKAPDNFSFFPGYVAPPPDGGGIYNSGNLTVISSTIAGNKGGAASPVQLCSLARHAMAAQSAQNPPVSSANGSGGWGGGIYNVGALVIDASVVADNVSGGETTSGSCGSDPPGNGGGIANANGTVSISDSTIVSNSTGLGGGCDFGGCEATGNGIGNGIANDGGVVSINNSTIAGNIPSGDIFGNGVQSGTANGGGIANDSGTTTISDTIVSANTATTSPDCSGTITSGDYNLVQDMSGCTLIGSTTHTITGTDPLLGPLQDNGGPTATRALQAGSAAIDYIPLASCGASTDQRGATSPDEGEAVCDIGAYESGSLAPATPTSLPTSTPLPPSETPTPPTATPTPPTATASSTPTATASSTPSPTPTATPSSTPTATPVQPTATPAPNCSLGENVSDPFDGPLSVSWQQSIPKPGPAFSTGTVPGCEELTIPAGQGAYDAFTVPGTYQADNAPELNRPDPNFGLTDWLALARVTLTSSNLAANSSNPNNGFLSGMTVRFSQTDQMFWGFYQTQGGALSLKMEHSGNANLPTVGAAGKTVTLAIHYRYAGGQCLYTFGYAFPGDTAFHALVDPNNPGQPETQSRCPATPAYPTNLLLGVGTKTFGDGAAVTTDFDWFDYVTGAPATALLGAINPDGNDPTCHVTRFPIDCATGNFYHAFDDLSIPGRGIPLRFSRTYNSLAASQNGPLGYGWSGSYGMALSTDSSGVITATEENGNVSTFYPAASGGYLAPARVLATLVQNADGTFTLTRKNQQRFIFAAPSPGAVGPLLSETDRNGYTTALTYTAPLSNDLVSRVTDPAGRSLTFGYDGNNHLTSIADPIGRTVVYTYNAAGDMTNAQDVRGNAWHYTYDGGHRLLTMTDPNGGTVTNTYDPASGRVSAQADPMGRTTTFSASTSPDFLGTTSVTVTSPNGNVSVEGYQDNELRSLTKGYGTPQQATWTYSYDPATLGVAATTDPNGHTTTNTYDVAGNLLTHTDALGRVTSYTYNAFDDVTSTTDPNGVTTYDTYDGRGNLVGVARPLYGLAGAHGGIMPHALVARPSPPAPLPRAGEGSSGAMSRIAAIARAARDAGALVRQAVVVGVRRAAATQNHVILAIHRSGRGRGVLHTPGSRDYRAYARRPYAPGTARLSAHDMALHTTTRGGTGRARTAFTAASSAGPKLSVRIAPSAARVAAGATLTYTVGFSNTTAQTTSVATATNVVLTDTLPLSSSLLGCAVSAPFGGACVQSGSLVSIALSGTAGPGISGTVALAVGVHLDAPSVITDGVVLSADDSAGQPLSPISATAVVAVSPPAPGRCPATGPLTATACLVYGDPAHPGDVTARTDADGHTSHFAYDPRTGDLITATDPLARVTGYAYDPIGRLTALVSPDGNVAGGNPLSYTTAMTYDAAGDLTVLTDRQGHTSTVGYDADGNAVARTDTLGRTTAYTYDLDNEPTRAQRPDGSILTTGYDGDGNVITRTDGLGDTTAYGYDALDRPITTSDPLSRTTSLAYDPAGNLSATTDALGRTTVYTYDAADQRVATLRPDGSVLTTGYDGDGQITGTVNGRGAATAYAYDSLNRLTAATDPLSRTTALTYDLAGNQTGLTDPRGFSTVYGYDAANQRTLVSYPDGGRVRLSYDANGNLTQETDPRGNPTRYGYDTLDRTVVVTDALGQTVRDGYDAVGNRIGMTNQRGYTTSYGYDALNRTAVVTDALGQTTALTYDLAGRETAMSDSLGRTTAYTYDAAGQQTAVLQPDGTVLTTTYDPVGNVAGRVDPNGHLTAYAYDGLNRTVAVTNPLGQATAYTYDLAGNLAQLTDPLTHTTAYTYDAADERTGVLQPDGSSLLTSYDAGGNAITQTDAVGQVTAYGYDALGRTVAMTDALGRTTAYGYDLTGNRTRLTDALGRVTGYSYDPLDRTTTITYSDGTTPRVGFAYTPTGLRQAMTDGTGITRYQYDALDRTVAVTNGAGQAVGYAYNPVDDTTAITYPGGVAVSRTFDALDRVTGLHDWLGHTTTYGYDPAGNPISETLPNTTSVVWGYDDADRLLGITRTAPLTAPRVYTYTRDGLGQVTSTTDSGEPTTHGYSYTALNQLQGDTSGITYTTNSAYDVLGITNTARGTTSSLG